jgi:S1-C subfamily serine protease
MIKIDKTQEDICAQKTLRPWLVIISVLIIVTIVTALYFADDIRRSQANRGQMQIGRFKVPGQMGQAAKDTARLTAFVPPWHGNQNPDAVTGATPRAMSFNQAIGIVSPSVVGINTSGGRQQSASGIIVHHFGYILTNYHVVKGAKDIVVTINFDQLIKSYSAQIFDSREVLDLAIIKIKPTGKEAFTPAPLGDSDRVYIGQWVVAIGNPFGLTQSASSGMVSNANRTLTAGDKVFDDLIQTDASINPGSSGGALVNPQGEVIGINTAIYSPTQAFSGISFAIPINQAKNAFPDLIEIVQSPLAKLNTQTAKANMSRPGTDVGLGYAPIQ